jgi:hypothetical protein
LEPAAQKVERQVARNNTIGSQMPFFRLDVALAEPVALALAKSVAWAALAEPEALADCNSGLSTHDSF